MSSPLAAIKALLSRKSSSVSTVIRGNGLSASVAGNQTHPKALPGDTLLQVKGRCIRLPKAPPAIPR